MTFKGVQALKLATRQYARRQLKWIKNRFVHSKCLHEVIQLGYINEFLGLLIEFLEGR